MDGGEGDEAPDLIDQSWAEIKKEPGMDKLQLSGWVVTHWDTDHYKGTLAWLGGKGKAELAENAFLVAGKDPNKYGIKLPVSYSPDGSLAPLTGVLGTTCHTLIHAPEHSSFRMTVAQSAQQLSTATYSRGSNQKVTRTAGRSFCAWPPTKALRRTKARSWQSSTGPRKSAAPSTRAATAIPRPPRTGSIG